MWNKPSFNVPKDTNLLSGSVRCLVFPKTRGYAVFETGFLPSSSERGDMLSGPMETANHNQRTTPCQDNCKHAMSCGDNRTIKIGKQLLVHIFVLSPKHAGYLPLLLRVETHPVSETLPFPVSRIPDDGQSPRTHNSERFMPTLEL
jgi:hypothetical protein